MLRDRVIIHGDTVDAKQCPCWLRVEPGRCYSAKDCKQRIVCRLHRIVNVTMDALLP